MSDYTEEIKRFLGVRGLFEKESPPPIKQRIPVQEYQQLIQDTYNHPDLTRNKWELNFTDPKYSNLKFHIKSIEFPSFGAFTYEIHKGWNYKYFSSFEVLDNVTLTFVETETFLITRFYNDWVSSFFDLKTRVFKSGNNPKRDATLTLYTDIDGPENASNTESGEVPPMEKKVIGTVLLKGLMPESLSPLTLDYSVGEPVDLSLVFSIDIVDYK